MMNSSENNESLVNIVLQETDSSILQSRKLFEDLAAYINSLIIDHFDELINLLYRMDVSEKKLKTLLLDHSSEDAASIIASLVIERQVQKLKTKAMFKHEENIPEDERW